MLARAVWRRARTVAELAAADVRLRRVRRQVARMDCTSDTAVVVHVHYPETWPTIAARLALLPAGLDLYVTLTDAAYARRAEILALTPDARLLRTPNVGRDVLPFIRVAAGLREAGYRSVLKLHGKRSVHADDGAEFLDACLHELVPTTDDAEECRRLVSSREIAVIGPESRLYPLAIHVWLNVDDIRWFFARWRPDRLHRLTKPSELSFFAGTMFWADLDAIASCLEVPTRRFEVESSQIDGTMAHALERLLVVVPEVDGRSIGVCGIDGPRRVEYTDHRWPAWALRRPEWE